MQIPPAVKQAVKATKPAMVIGVRRLKMSGGGVEVPGYVHTDLEGATFDDVAVMLAAFQTLFIQLVQQLAQTANIREQDFHQKIREHMEGGRTGGNGSGPG